jgi:hypothetical protein
LPNDFGLFDVLGDARERCQDRNTRYRCQRSESLLGEITHDDLFSYRVVRGGSFTRQSAAARSADCDMALISQVSTDIGFPGKPGPANERRTKSRPKINSRFRQLFGRTCRSFLKGGQLSVVLCPSVGGYSGWRSPAWFSILDLGFGIQAGSGGRRAPADFKKRANEPNSRSSTISRGRIRCGIISKTARTNPSRTSVRKGSQIRKTKAETRRAERQI